MLLLLQSSCPYSPLSLHNLATLLAQTSHAVDWQLPQLPSDLHVFFPLQLGWPHAICSPGLQAPQQHFEPSLKLAACDVPCPQVPLTTMPFGFPMELQYSLQLSSFTVVYFPEHTSVRPSVEHILPTASVIFSGELSV